MIDTKQVSQYLEEAGIPQRETVIEQLDRFAALLVQRNKAVNLTAITDPEGIAVKHLIDSLMVFKYAHFPQGAKVIDVGCGAGFPSMPMLIAKNDLQMTFLDSTGKKLAFIEDCLETLGLEATVLHARAEEQARKNVSRETFDFAVARAVANLRSLCELTLPFVKPGGCFLALKGKEGKEEWKQAQNAIAQLGGKTQELFAYTLPDASERTMILIKKISQTPTKYPRASTAIMKKPL
ncbi:MAG: 16S rRNA (guanine(527)-N(7))-methyltransferase RsmG [Ruminococcaceae bacterium]|nr:16S rRNA (guanine(527)-N(7))-methyltransferase RsmG [Oscillospiraceae bacterium]